MPPETQLVKLNLLTFRSPVIHHPLRLNQAQQLAFDVCQYWGSAFMQYSHELKHEDGMEAAELWSESAEHRET